ncbi:GNAT family N-acetyltransferase [Streptomyces hydrogenans]|uniref:GNAT family N-acetyltransferase n=1 Tax=Streptomyces hydrogenans TaxID=1873719 RepID=UPI00363A3461
MPYVIEPASPADITLLMSLRSEAEEWLTAKGSDQWSDRETGTAAISKWHAAIEEGRTWIVRDVDRGLSVATVSRGPADLDFWNADDRPENAFYIYKLMVRRDSAGLGIGSLIIDWASRVAALEGREYVRIDCWRTASGLQRYYENLGFEHVRTEAPTHRKSGWLGQRSSLVTLGDDDGMLRPASAETVHSRA